MLNNHVAALLLPAMALFAARVLPHHARRQFPVQRLGHRRLDVRQQLLLVAFDGQDVIAAAVHDLLGDRLLAAHGVDGHQRPLQVQQVPAAGEWP